MVPPFKRNQSPIVFDRIQPRISAITNSGSNSEPPQIFHYARSSHHMMRRMGYNLQQENGLNFDRGRHGLLRTFVPKGKPTNYYDKTRRGLGYVTPPILFQSEDDESLPSHSATSSEWESDVSVGMPFKNLSLMCPAGMSLHMLLQTCRHNFLDQVEICMGVVKAHT